MRGIDKLIPEAQDAAKQLLKECEHWGLDVLITDTLRTKDEQNALYAQGRTASGNIVTSCKYPQSLHNWGCAFDFCRNVKGKEYYDGDGFFERVGTIAESIGLVWGGHFRKPDRPHIQLAKYAPDKTAKALMAKYDDPQIFINEKKGERENMSADDILKLITPEMAREIMLKGMAQLAKYEPTEEWKSGAIKWAKINEIFEGDANGNMMPEKPITRAELAKVLMRYTDYILSL